ncbi:hypothetical protein FM037_05085 [Shewanella psychropiezotolerans]|uniref:Uncharacterized protein n=1 Tax=Shewanella psychropiezotolerans TaxID=2593655 RepID=A0ABX5WUF5_9GAMM|nr:MULTISPECIES: hypothetical protein [Shewanella]MPY23067.1 hypothetical protein [Shewanella sp. YLB-07]QDO82722.1 hypothetical protein FM037_05085 [Shewanella psychropiezotolerans]
MFDISKLFTVMGTALIAVLILFTSLLVVAGGRLRPPADFACEPNHMTSWTGVLVFYWRDASQLGFTIDTDDGTQESLITPYSLNKLLINGEHFTYEDWSKVESEVGLLKPMTRARIWLCDNDGNATLIDWQIGTFL